MEIYNDTYCVYVHTNIANGKKYVGQTKQSTHTRWREGKGYTGSPYFYRAIRKYGWNSFLHEVIASHLTKKEADIFEILLIAKLDTTNSDKGYNMTSGGEGSIPNEETRRKMSEAVMGEKNHNYGKHPTQETLQKLSEAHSGENSWWMGKHHSEETKQKLREKKIGKKFSEEEKKKMSESRKGEKHWNYGKHWSDEVKHKISESNKGHKNSPEARRKISEHSKGRKHSQESKNKIRSKKTGHAVLQFDSDGNFIKQWNCTKQAAKELHLSPSNIRSVCLGIYKTSGGFIWKYVDEE